MSSGFSHVFIGLFLVGVVLTLRILRESIAEWESLCAMRFDLGSRKAKGEKGSVEESARIDELTEGLKVTMLELKETRSSQQGVLEQIDTVEKSLEKIGSSKVKASMGNKTTTF